MTTSCRERIITSITSWKYAAPQFSLLVGQEFGILVTRAKEGQEEGPVLFAQGESAREVKFLNFMKAQQAYLCLL